ncbi:AAA family ATPase [Algoriphagus halophytocola]|uniref:AAA family ATPase n=1 Tax=Algoriphagus halophytocola TaxID=2991499 RepID=A0ABY6ML51_9BACT|nr:AAA family ATPase [Algoriphagus sp. TR-M5]UZD23908.1 AAA family ATPase [Algoriphagus sp. TR-M5]
MKKEYAGREEQSLYVSLDHIWFATHSLVDLADQFSKQGGVLLVLDEVHKYPNWSREIKNIYDFYPELNLIFTGSSLLEIFNASADLSRRAFIYQMTGLSFREYVNLEKGLRIPKISLEEIFTNHIALATEISSQIRPLQFFPSYLENGYYPFYRDFGDFTAQQISAVVNLILEVELPQLRKFDIAYVPKIKQLLSIISDSVPFIPNVSKLSQKIGINRTTLLTYLNYLHESKLTTNLYSSSTGISLLQKPEKLYLENTNLAFALGNNVDVGNLRETFFLNQLSHNHSVTLPVESDFIIDQRWKVEVGGRNKDLPKANSIDDFIAADGIEVGFGKKIPLWLFGYLY